MRWSPFYELLQQAKLRGEEVAYTGVPCVQGHLHGRLVRNGYCAECERIIAENKPPKVSGPLSREQKDIYNATRRHRYANDEEYRRQTLDYNQKRYRDDPAYRLKFAEYTRAWSKVNRASVNYNSGMRRAARRNATPKWLTESMRAEIKAFYQEAARRTLEEGVRYSVDHIVPLRGKNVCGLHVPWNLQVITLEENNRKHNTIPDEVRLISVE